MAIKPRRPLERVNAEYRRPTRRHAAAQGRAAGAPESSRGLVAVQLAPTEALPQAQLRFRRRSVVVVGVVVVVETMHHTELLPRIRRGQ